MTDKPTNSAPPELPVIWDYTDYRKWLTDTFLVRKALHSWYSYGVLAQRAGFKARDFLLRVMRGERNLSSGSAERLASALDLPRREIGYFLALVNYNQARDDFHREAAWKEVESVLPKTVRVSAPRLLTAVHRKILSEWHVLALRSLLEMTPDSGEDCTALGRRLFPAQTASVVRHDLALLEEGKLIERREDGLWHATEKSIAISPEVGAPAARAFHRSCLKLAASSLDDLSPEERSVTGLTLGISASTYQCFCRRLRELSEEFAAQADADAGADEVYQLTLALFPLTRLKKGSK